MMSYSRLGKTEGWSGGGDAWAFWPCRECAGPRPGCRSRFPSRHCSSRSGGRSVVDLWWNHDRLPSATWTAAVKLNYPHPTARGPGEPHGHTPHPAQL